LEKQVKPCSKAKNQSINIFFLSLPSQLAILGAQQSFGEEEVFGKCQKRNSKAIAYSSIVELFSIRVEVQFS